MPYYNVCVNRQFENRRGQLLQRISIFVFLSLFPINIGAQFRTVDPSLTIIVKDGSYKVTGVVGSESEREKLLMLVRKNLGVAVPENNIQVIQFQAELPLGWEQSIASDLAKLKSWTSGAYRWTVDPQKAEREFTKFLASIKIREIDKPEESLLIDRSKKLTIVNLTATWVGPSRMELPALNKLYDSYKNAGLDVVMLTVEESDSLQAMQKWSEQLGLQFRVGIAPVTLADRFVNISKFNGIPQNFVLKDGRLVLITRGAGPSEIARLKDFVDSELR